MRYKLALLIVMQILVVSIATIKATDLRGGVAGYNAWTNTTGPLPGIPVGLFAPNQYGQFDLVRQTQTGLDGMYYLMRVIPGTYVLQIGGVNYPLTVWNTQTQDIPIIYR
jgi:hypothetical protein